jgi:2-methylcitrate dehydratase PrpD
LAQRLTFEVSAANSDNATRGELTLVTKAGAEVSMFIEHPLGHSSRPMSEAALIAKFNDCAALARRPLATAKCQQLIAAVLSLEQQGPLDARFFELLGV